MISGCYIHRITRNNDFNGSQMALNFGLKASHDNACGIQKIMR
jgi:hypothetical protein